MGVTIRCGEHIALFCCGMRSKEGQHGVIALEVLGASPNVPGVAQHAATTLRFGGVAIDSRAVMAGDLFVALPGEHVDGHQFVAAALAGGAHGALVRRAWLREHGDALAPHATLIDTAEPVASIDQVRPVVVAVDDPLATLQHMAHVHRLRMSAHVIGITGSVGKTSTKEVVAAVLRQRFRTLHSGKSFNNEIGVPLTLLRLEPEHEVGVVEMGTYGPGEIAFLCRLAHPTIAIVTNVGVSHLERMGSPDVVAVAKRELVEALPADGVAILNDDDERVRGMVAYTTARPLLYGTTPRAELWVNNIERRGLNGIAFDVHYHGDTLRIETPLLGQHAVYIALPAIAAGLVLDMPWEQIVAGLQDASMQSRIGVVPGLNGATILDDTYNASPASCQAALDLLADVPAGERVAVFGDMAELGPIEEAGHRVVGRAAAAVVDRLIVVGRKARWIADAARETNALLPIICTETNHEAAAALRPLLKQNMVVLVKGARVARTEAIVAALRGGGDTHREA